MAGLSWQVEISQKRAERQKLWAERDQLIQERKEIEAAQGSPERIKPEIRNEVEKLEIDAHETRRALRDVIGEKRAVSQKLASVLAVTPGENPIQPSGLRRTSHSIAEAEELLKQDAAHLSEVTIQLELIEKKIPIEVAVLEKLQKQREVHEELLQQARVRGYPKEELSTFEQLEFERIQRSLKKSKDDLQRLAFILPTTRATAGERIAHRRQVDRLKSSVNELQRELRTILSKGQMETETALKGIIAEIEKRKKIIEMEYAEKEMLLADQKATTTRMELLQKEAGPIARMMEAQRVRSAREAHLLAEEEHAQQLRRIQEEKIRVEMKEQALRSKLREIDTALTIAQSKAKTTHETVVVVPSDLLARQHAIEQRLMVLDREIVQLQQEHQAG